MRTVTCDKCWADICRTNRCEVRGCIYEYNGIGEGLGEKVGHDQWEILSPVAYELCVDCFISVDAFIRKPKP